ncbi:peroxisomal membrane anchor protein conserved region-domain-containing protein [Sporodiniella umbellata]|nr:peroxisomal membrane anchor protein conserved region-domain-containing protein [Sporodiniella umbellata]
MREDLLASAIAFLKSPNVKTASKEKKTQFLEKKGLTQEEINEAFKQTESELTEVIKPIVPPRQTIQVVYYPLEALPVRMTTQQIVKVACIVGLGATGIITILLAIIQRCMSRVLGSITRYQSDRYKTRADFLKRLQTILEKQDPDYTTLIKEQDSLDTRLNRLATLIRSKSCLKQSTLKSSVDSLRTVFTSLPQSGFYSYGSGDGFVSSSNRLPDDNPSIQALKSEIRSFKGALLSRRNFPSITQRSSESLETPQLSTNSYHPRRKRLLRSELPSGFTREQ